MLKASVKDCLSVTYRFKYVTSRYADHSYLSMNVCFDAIKIIADGTVYIEVLSVSNADYFDSTNC
jgi:hypothetical protein